MTVAGLSDDRGGDDIHAGWPVDQAPRLVTKWLPVTLRDGVEPGAALSAGEGPGGGPPASKGALTLVASTEAEDRAGDLIVASGWDLAAYRRNPVFLWAHDYSRPVIGRSLRTWLDGGLLLATIEFAPTPFAQEVRSLYAGGFMRGVSVGFRALETEPRTGAGGKRGLLFKRQELLEISAAPVPVNARALARPAIAGSGRSASRPPVEDRDGAAAALSQIRELWGELAGFAAGGCFPDMWRGEARAGPGSIEA